MYIRLLSVLILLIGLNLSLSAQNKAVELDYYLPSENYNPNITTPEEFFGFQVGQWHLTPHQVVSYIQHLSEQSPRFELSIYARSYENRPVVQAVVTSESNQSRIEEIRQNHLKLADPKQSEKVNIEDQPVIVWMGYSVHGNEPSGTNASVLFAYYLAASESAELKKWLDHAVVLMDPVINPDGGTRFAQHVNSFRSIQNVTDPNSFELNENWPGGRTNHYWFDLNRDWLLQQHPESRGRIERFHHWLPNVLTDHHEMGSNSSFFFMPGIPSRTNPLTPEKNQLLTALLGNYHADELDNIGSLYYTQESFDDFYYGKGSTYPDIFGGVGILFEQGSSRGHYRDTENGELAFHFTVRNQVKTSFSTLKGSVENKGEFLNYFRDFYKEQLTDARSNSTIKAYIIGDKYDRTRTNALVDVLHRHGVELRYLKEAITIKGQEFESNSSYVALVDENHPGFLKVAFEERTSFTDSTFYDVSAWSLQHAFNVPVETVDKKGLRSLKYGETIKALESNSKIIRSTRTSSPVAFVFSWDDFDAAKVLLNLQEAGIRLKIATNPFQLETAEGPISFDEGAVMIPFGQQNMQITDLVNVISEAISNTNVTVYEAETGLTSSGIDLGSRNFEHFNPKKVAIVVGEGVASYEAGEVWHLFDQRLEHGITLLQAERLSRANLSDYSTLVMVNGRYDSSESTVRAVRDFVRGGGTVVATKGSILWLRANKLIDISTVESAKPPLPEFPSYNSSGRYSGAQVTGGTIFSAELDITHPLGYGFKRNIIPIFRNHNTVYELHDNPFGSPLRYTSSPLLAGYVSEENLKRIKNSAAINVFATGSGRIIAFADNPNFRAYWWGTNRLFINAVLFGDLISSSTAR